MHMLLIDSVEEVAARAAHLIAFTSQFPDSLAQPAGGCERAGQAHAVSLSVQHIPYSHPQVVWKCTQLGEWRSAGEMS